MSRASIVALTRSVCAGAGERPRAASGRRAWIEERDEALPSREVAVADRAQRNRRRFLQCVAVVEPQLRAHPECDALFMPGPPPSWPTMPLSMVIQPSPKPPPPTPRHVAVCRRIRRALAADNRRCPLVPTPSFTWASAKVATSFAASMAVAPAGAKLGFRNANEVRAFVPSVLRKWPTVARWSNASAECTTECRSSSGLKIRSSMSVYQLFRGAVEPDSPPAPHQSCSTTARRRARGSGPVAR